MTSYAWGQPANDFPHQMEFLYLPMADLWGPDGETFNGQANVLTPEYVATLAEGDVLDNDEQNPLLYHKSKPAVSP